MLRIHYTSRILLFASLLLSLCLEPVKLNPFLFLFPSIVGIEAVALHNAKLGYVLELRGFSIDSWISSCFLSVLSLLVSLVQWVECRR